MSMSHNACEPSSRSADRCARCVRSSSRIEVQLDDQHVCQLCRGLAAPQPKWSAQTDWNTFADTLQSRYCGAVSRYHCMVLFSGGKDSTYMLHLLSGVPGLRLLAVTVDHWFQSPQAEANMRRVLENVPVDHVLLRPAWGVAGRLYREVAARTGELCLTCEAYLTTELYHLAVELRIPSVAWGLSAQQFRTPPNWLTEIDMAYWHKMHERFVMALGRTIGLDSELFLQFSMQYVPELTGKEDLLPDLVFPYIALGYDANDVESSVAQLGWRRPDDVAGASSNCYANHLHGCLKRARLSRAAIEDSLSNLVRAGTISRERAIAILEEQPDKDIAAEILSKIGLTSDIEALAASLTQAPTRYC